MCPLQSADPGIQHQASLPRPSDAPQLSQPQRQSADPARPAQGQLPGQLPENLPRLSDVSQLSRPQQHADPVPQSLGQLSGQLHAQSPRTSPPGLSASGARSNTQQQQPQQQGLRDHEPDVALAAALAGAGNPATSSPKSVGHGVVSSTGADAGHDLMASFLTDQAAEASSR